VKRLVRLIFHNWPLKLAALVLATLLYAGLVISQSAQELNGSVPIVPLNQPANAVLGANLPQVTRIRYIAIGDPNARASTDSFQATIDLSTVDPTAGSVYVKIDVESRDPRFRVLEYEPPGINVQLDPRGTKQVPVHVEKGPIPSGLDVRESVVTPAEVIVSGPQSVIDRVVAVRADVNIEPSGLDVDRDVELVPVDVVGDRVTPADVEPNTAHVRIAVFLDSRTRSVPIHPVVTGTPAAGFEIAAITTEPLLALVEGDGDELSALTRADTAPVSISGATQSVSSDVALDLPSGVLAVGPDETVTVTVEIRPLAGTRVFDAGMRIVGGRTDLDYRVSVTHALATVGGPVADLERLDAAAFTLLVQVGGLGVGTHQVALAANLPVGLTLVAVLPEAVTVTVSLLASPSPAASP
jgi:YbbR domain-containing protein